MIYITKKKDVASCDVTEVLTLDVITGNFSSISGLKDLLKKEVLSHRCLCLKPTDGASTVVAGHSDNFFFTHGEPGSAVYSSYDVDVDRQKVYLQLIREESLISEESYQALLREYDGLSPEAKKAVLLLSPEFGVKFSSSFASVETPYLKREGGVSSVSLDAPSKSLFRRFNAGLCLYPQFASGLVKEDLSDESSAKAYSHAVTSVAAALSSGARHMLMNDGLSITADISMIDDIKHAWVNHLSTPTPSIEEIVKGVLFIEAVGVHFSDVVKDERHLGHLSLGGFLAAAGAVTSGTNPYSVPVVKREAVVQVKALAGRVEVLANSGTVRAVIKTPNPFGMEIGNDALQVALVIASLYTKADHVASCFTGSRPPKVTIFSPFSFPSTAAFADCGLGFIRRGYNFDQS